MHRNSVCGNRPLCRRKREILELEEFVRKANQASRTNHALKRMGQNAPFAWRKAKGEADPRPDLQTYKMDIHFA